MEPSDNRRLRRLAEELEEGGLPTLGSEALKSMLLEEIDRALRPAVHERRVPSGGTILDPKVDAVHWSVGTQLEISRYPIEGKHRTAFRPFVDGLSSWLLRRTEAGGDEWVLFDRPAGSERDLVVLADVMDATIVQRHPTGVVRVVGDFGVLRWEGITWHHEPPIATWVVEITGASLTRESAVVESLLRLAVHDLGSLGIGALLVYRPEHGPGPPVEERLPIPPPLKIRTPSHLAPLRHALAHEDGAAFFDAEGQLCRLGVRLVPSAAAESAVEPLGGTRHTSALAYSRDDPSAVVIVVSEDGPVSVLRNGGILPRPSALARRRDR